jgi:hypothetical protein
MGLQQPIYCRICGQAVNPQHDVLFGAAGRPLFAAHAGACEAKVRQGVGLIGQTLQGLLRQKAPRAFDLLNTAVQLAGQMQHRE